jgi:hypothetical protein
MRTVQPPSEAQSDQEGLGAGPADVLAVTFPYAFTCAPPGLLLLAFIWAVAASLQLHAQADKPFPMQIAESTLLLQMPWMRFHFLFFLSYILFVRPLCCCCGG